MPSSFPMNRHQVISFVEAMSRAMGLVLLSALTFLAALVAAGRPLDADGMKEALGSGNPFFWALAAASFLIFAIALIVLVRSFRQGVPFADQTS